MAVDVILTDENFTPQQYSVSVGVALSKVGGGTQTFYITDGTETISDMSVHNVQSKAFAQVVEPNLSAGNIRSGVSILGTVGDYITPGTTKSVTLDFSGGDMSIGASGEERWNQIDIFKPATLIPGNIANGIEIAGVIGNMQAIRMGDIFNKTLTVLEDDTVLSVPSGYFSGFSMLSYVSIPSCVSIGSSGFQSCTALNVIYAPACTYIGNAAFGSCANIQPQFFPEVEIIEAQAFSGVNTQLSFGSKILSVGPWAFEGNTVLSSIYLGNCISIGNKAFGSANHLSIDFGNSVPNYVHSSFISYSNDYVQSSGTNNVFKWYGPIGLTGRSGTYYIPSIPDGIKVICPYFYGLSGINFGTSQFVLPSSLEVLCEYAFYSQTGLSFAMNLAEPASNLRYIGTQALPLGNRSLCLAAPKLSYIGSSAFSSIYNNRSYFKAAWFSTSLSVGSYAFKSASSTLFINSAFTLTYAGSEAFASCQNLSAKVRILNTSTQGIGSSAFAYCISLPTVVLDNCSHIGGSAFYSCTHLESLYVLGYSTNMAPGTFANTPLGVSSYLGHYGSIFIDPSIYSAMLTKVNWSAFSSRFVKMTESEVEAIRTLFDEAIP